MAVHVDSVSQVYARSIFELAEQAGGRDKIVEVGEELEQICEVARADRAFREFLRSPLIDKRSRSASISRIFSDNVTDLVLRFLLVMNEKGRLGLLESVAAGYDQLTQESFGRVEVDLYTPAPLGDAQLERIRERVQAALGKEPVLYPYTDPSMIGGIRLRIGDRLIDASVVTQLRRMRDRILGGGGAALRERIESVAERIIDQEGSSQP